MLRTTAIWGSTQGAPYYSTFHFLGSTATAAAAHGATVALLQLMDNYIDASYTWTVDSEVAEVDPATGFTTNTAIVPSVSGAGAVVGVETALATQWLLRWRTGVYLNGREVRGRTFLPGWIAANLVSGRPAAASIALINPILATWLAGPGVDFAVWSPTKGVVHEVTSASMWDQMAVLRSRRD